MTIREIIEELRERLEEIQRLEKLSMGSRFDEGYDCRLANEEMWLQELLLRLIEDSLNASTRDR